MGDPADDILLLPLLRKGDMKAFDALFRKHAPKLLRFSISLTGNRDDAEEIVQETFLKVWEQRGAIDETRRFDAYIAVIARNAIYDRFRRKLTERKYSERIGEALYRYVSDENDLHIKELRSIMLKSFDRLSPQQREILILKSKGFGNDEIATMLGISKRTVEAHLNKAYAALRTELRAIKDILPIITVLFNTL